ncbi:murein hydrolase activator EnvC family protein [Listeria valentina]|uniref:murein hydrolase activator EnvC family protein n=1 Tax=Listeria valentina TaxID=2705293 RepID=UPI00142FBA20|nr:M23 family metallopeptidase [Listeria valentina]
MKKNKTISFAATIAAAVLILQPVNVFASNISELEKQKQGITEERSSVEKGIETKHSELNQIESDTASVKATLERVSKEIDETNAKLKEQVEKVNTEQKQVQKLKQEIATLKEEIKQRQKVLEKRARAIQTSGSGKSYLTILMQAEDFSDFIDRANLVQVIVKSDQEIMEKQKSDQKLLKDKQDASEKKLAELNKMKDQIMLTKNNLESQKAEQNDLISSLAAKKNKTAQETALLESQKSKLSSQEQTLLSNISAAYAEEQRKKEEAAKRAMEEQRRQAAAHSAASARSAAPRSSKSVPAASSPVAQAPSTGGGSSSSAGGMFIKPAQGILTSGFSDRTNPVTGQHESHKGQDIAAGGTVQVVAAASGRVVFAGYGAPGSGYGGYGYVVEIDHGNGYQTLYGHMRAGSLNVVAGQNVMQGQAIGIMGSTGQSTGQHLHFEIHKNGVPINPAPYL